MKYSVSDLRHASFIYSDDGEMDHIKDDSCTSEILFRDNETTQLSQRDGKLILENSTTTNSSNVHEFNVGVRRTSPRSFLDLCDSFLTYSPHEMASSVAAQVKENLRKSLPESLLKDRDDQECIAPFMTKEIVLGRKLGSGEFSHVYRVKSFRLDNSLESSFSTEECARRHHMRRTENYHNTKKCSYALKHLRPDLINKYESNEYALLARDLVQEAELLAVLQHPNIITLRGTSLFGHNGFAQGPKGYFMILDRLEETLFDRIAMWKRSTRPRRRSWLLCKQTKEKGSINEGCTLTEQLLSQQLEVALQVAAAIVYLHDKNIIYRDLKPANVGFDVQGNVKLFDFGLAKVMPLNGDPYHDKFVMSGAGSPRYMAPEVLSSKTTYNLKADVYTFGVVLWEVLSLEKPYAFIRSMDTLIEHGEC